MKDFDDNFKFEENGGRFSRNLENTVGTGEIARYEQFLLFPQCFQKTCTADTLKGLVWERMNVLLVDVVRIEWIAGMLLYATSNAT